MAYSWSLEKGGQYQLGFHPTLARVPGIGPASSPPKLLRRLQSKCQQRGAAVIATACDELIKTPRYQNSQALLFATSFPAVCTAPNKALIKSRANQQLR